MFNAPIPGMSLTTEPKGRPWENPPQYDDVDDVVEYYVDKLSKEEVIDNLVELMDLGIPIKAIVTGITRMSVMNGIHTIDVSLLVGPFLHEYLKLLAKSAGANYDEGFAKKDAKKVEDASLAARVGKALDNATPDEGTEIMESTQAVLEGDTTNAEAEVASTTLPKPRGGLGGRKVTNV